MKGNRNEKSVLRQIRNLNTNNVITTRETQCADDTCVIGWNAPEELLKRSCGEIVFLTFNPASERKMCKCSAMHHLENLS